MTNSVMVAKKQRYTAAKSGRAGVKKQVMHALTSGQPTRLMDLRRLVCAGTGVDSLPEGKLTRALRELQAEGLVHRPRRGYYQLVTAPTARTSVIPQQRDQHDAVEHSTTVAAKAEDHEPAAAEPAVAAPMAEELPVATTRAVAMATVATKTLAIPAVATPVVASPTVATKALVARANPVPVVAAPIVQMPRSTHSIEPIEPIEPVELIEPVERIEPVQLVEPVEPVEFSAPTEPAHSTPESELAEPNARSEHTGFIVGALCMLAWFVATGMALLLLGATVGLVVGGVFGCGLVVMNRVSSHRRGAVDATRDVESDSGETPDATVEVIDAFSH